MEFIIFDFNDIGDIVSIIYDWLFFFLTKGRYQSLCIPFDNRNHDRSSVVLQKSLYIYKYVFNILLIWKVEVKKKILIILNEISCADLRYSILDCRRTDIQCLLPVFFYRSTKRVASISSIVSVFNTNEFRRYSVSYNLFRDRLHNRVEWRHYLAEDYVYLTTVDESDFKFDLTNTKMTSSIESVRKSICSKVEHVVLAGWCCFLLLSVCCCFVTVLLYFDDDAFDSVDMRQKKYGIICVVKYNWSFFWFDCRRRSGFVFSCIRILRKWYLRYVFFIEKSWRFFNMILE